jgi:hypothetical protein
MRTVGEASVTTLEGSMRAAEKETPRTLRPDSKGRITLGRAAEGVSGFQMEQREDGTIILKPMVEIPAREAWLHRNKKALASVQKGLEQSAKGQTKDLGSFARYADD